MSIADSPLRETMVFLVGARRSGTNWLQRVLGAHPDVFAIPSETHVISHGLGPLSERVHHGALGGRRTAAVFMERTEFLDASREFCDRLFDGLRERSDPGAHRVVERTPWHANSVDLITDVYPDSWVLHIIRDGRDVARSLIAQPWGPDTMQEAAEEWRESVESARRARKPAHYREIRYEELLADPAGEVPQLIGWLGLDAGDGVVEEMLTEAGIEFNVDPSAPGARAGKWTSLSPAELAEFEEVAGPLNSELGYGSEGAEPGGAPAGERATNRSRRRLGAARRRLKGEASKGSFEREALNRLEHSEYVFERLLEAMHADPGRLGAILTDEANVLIANGDSEWRGRGAEAVERLIEALEEDPARGGRQLRGDVHRGIPTFTAVLSYELPDGSRIERVASARIREDRVTELSIYTFTTADSQTA